MLVGCLIASMKQFDALITMLRTSALCKVPFLKKSRKTTQKISIFEKNVILADFPDFF